MIDFENTEKDYVRTAKVDYNRVNHRKSINIYSSKLGNYKNSLTINLQINETNTSLFFFYTYLLTI